MQNIYENKIELDEYAVKLGTNTINQIRQKDINLDNFDNNMADMYE